MIITNELLVKSARKLVYAVFEDYMEFFLSVPTFICPVIENAIIKFPKITAENNFFAPIKKDQPNQLSPISNIPLEMIVLLTLQL